eukprot:CAMPEP_0115847542 /NCGR_PEP_ID=MMETSP0287-20121206/10437_1 /TAXON_ID=412157 /ORGANISM="Chrysochromulina rotalis, Strain UIO044" /LENGTH=286 /DNA_ID=CAMNT_0003301381 /DNA_START=11 /DNA_END=871 /DNA_ORIENTATION=+
MEEEPSEAAAEDLYALLGIARDASPDAIKKAYLQRARVDHPDKNPGDSSAHARFQALGRAYSTLRDPERRKVYDAAGIIDDGPSQGEKQWYDFWRDFFTRVTTDRIDALAAEYRGSEEEVADLRDAYLAARGDMGGIIDRMMCSTQDDEPRFREMVRADVAAGMLRKFKAFESEPAARKEARKRSAAKEADEAEELARELGLGGAGGSDDALRTALLSRQSQRHESLLATLAEKYAHRPDKKNSRAGSSGSSSKLKKKAAADPLADDAAFEAAQRRMLSGVSKSKR